MKSTISAGAFFFNVESASKYIKELRKKKNDGYFLDKFFDFSIACYSKTIAATLCNPVNVIKTRVEAQDKSEILITFRKTFKNGGPLSFFKGYGATLIRDVPYSGLQFLFYRMIFDLEPLLFPGNINNYFIWIMILFQKIKKYTN